MTERKESAADITVNVGEDTETVESLSVTKSIDVETIYGSGHVLPDGYAINQISYEGDMTLTGNRLDLDSVFFDGGVPKIVDAITITHRDDTETSYQDVIVTSEGYEMSAGETVTTSYNFIAMKKTQSGTTDTEESD